ncbi:MAG TPA: FAD-dependent oxidoreductase [Rubricoccaceae bacterium]|jgi:hypothetical protein
MTRPPPSVPVCVVGAGVAGLAAAHALGAVGVAAVVVDKSRGVGGRAATRWRDVPDATGAAVRWRVDHGAQVFTPEPGSRAARLVRDVLPPGDLVELPGAVWPFDDDGALRPDRERADGPPRLAFRAGFSALGRALAAATPGLHLRPNTAATRLVHERGGWTVEATGPDGPVHLGPFRAVVLTPPGPQAGALVGASTFEAAVRDPLADALGAATYRSQFSVVLAFAEPVALPGGVYALVNAPEPGGAERSPHPVAWLAVESDKPGRAPDGMTLLVAQMSGPWTFAHYDEPPEAVVAHAVSCIEGLVGALPPWLWTDTQRWRYSLPDGRVDAAALGPAEALGLFVAGDAVAGQGRVHLAIESGLDAAARVAALLGP